MSYTNKASIEHYVNFIMVNAPFAQQRTGQFLFNNLEAPIADKVRGTNIDPFYKNLTKEEVKAWVERHLIFSDNGQIVALYADSNILWTRE